MVYGTWYMVYGMWYLVPPQGDGQGDVQRLVDHAGYRLDQRHEEQREPDDADEQQHDEAAHPELHHTLLPLAARLGVALHIVHTQSTHM